MVCGLYKYKKKSTWRRLTWKYNAMRKLASCVLGPRVLQDSKLEFVHAIEFVDCAMQISRSQN